MALERAKTHLGSAISTNRSGAYVSAKHRFTYIRTSRYKGSHTMLSNRAGNITC